jgi:hypothetical protein
MEDTEYETLHGYVFDAMLEETGWKTGAFYLLASGAKEMPRAHVVTGHPAFEKLFEAEFRRRADSDQNPDHVFVFLEH